MKNVKTNNKLPCGILGEGKEKLSNCKNLMY